MGDQIYPSEQF